MRAPSEPPWLSLRLERLQILVLPVRHIAISLRTKGGTYGRETRLSAILHPWRMYFIVRI